MNNKPNKQILWLFGIITVFCLAMAGTNHYLEVKKEKEWQDKHSVKIAIQVNKKDEKFAAEILQLIIKRLEKMKMINVATAIDGNVITITVGGVTEKDRLQQFIAQRGLCTIKSLNDDAVLLQGANGPEFFDAKTKYKIPENDIVKHTKLLMPSKNLSFSASISKTKSSYEIPVSVTPRTKAGEFSRYMSEHNGDYLLYFVDDKLLTIQEITDSTIQAIIPLPRSDGIGVQAQEEERVKAIVQAIQLLYPYPADVSLQSISN